MTFVNRLPSSGGHSLPEARLRGRWRLILRATWLALVVATLSLFSVGLPASFRRLQTACPRPSDCVSFQLFTGDSPALRGLGLSIRFYAAYATLLSLFAILVILIAAAVLHWRKSSTWMPVYLSFGLVALLPTFFTNATTALVRMNPAWRLPVGYLEALGLCFSLVGLFLFPDGRFVPRWVRWLAVVIAPYALVRSFPASVLPSLMPLTLINRLLLFILLGLAATGLGAQVYRYRRVSGSVERQQTRWVVFGIAGLVLNEAVFLLLPTFLPAVGQPGLPHVLYRLVGGTLNVSFLLFFLLCLAISIVRFRLWEIDILIRRTLIYGALTAALALFYFGSVVLLQELFRAVTGQGQNQLVTVISTLAIAALFTPLRRGVQKGIDRRFYRRKYDAAKTLGAFSATVRDEVDLNRLTERLLEIVQETMQPAHVSLWLRQEGVKHEK